MSNAKILDTKQMDAINTPLSIVIAFVISVFRWAPKTFQGWAFLILCTVAAILYFAPFTIYTAEFFSRYYSFLGFLNPQENPVVPVMAYFINTLFAYPILAILMGLFERVLPHWLRGRFNARRD